MQSPNLAAMSSDQYRAHITQMASRIKDTFSTMKTTANEEADLCTTALADIQAHTDPGFDPQWGRSIEMFFEQETPRRISLMTGWKGDPPYVFDPADPPYNAFIGMDKMDNIAHYGYRFDESNGGRFGHWNVTLLGQTPMTVALSMVWDSKTKYLSAEAGGDMRLTDGIGPDEQFVITGHEFRASVQRRSDFMGKLQSGYVQGLPVGVTDQNDVNAKANDERRTWFRIQSH